MVDKRLTVAFVLFLSTGVFTTQGQLFENEKPRADAGDDFAVGGETQVFLDGSKSFDPDGGELSYRWRLDRAPFLSAVRHLQFADSAYPSFIPDIGGEYDVSLEVCDPCDLCDQTSVKVFVKCPQELYAELTYNGETSKTVSVTQNHLGTEFDPNNFAFSKLTLDQSHGVNVRNATNSTDIDAVKCSGSESSCVVNGIKHTVDRTFRFDSIPHCSSLTSADLVDGSHTVEFTPDSVGKYVIVVEVNDHCTKAQATVEIEICDSGTGRCFCNECLESNVLPKWAGADTELVVDGVDPVSLVADFTDDDTDLAALSYNWTLTRAPRESSLDLSSSNITNSTAKEASFVPDATGDYFFTVVVSDGCGTVEQKMKVSVKCLCRVKAHAGSDQTMTDLKDVEVWGLKSEGCEGGNELSYSWTFDRLPGRSHLSDGSIRRHDKSRAYFTPDVRGKYRLKLTVNDGCSTSVDFVDIEIVCTFKPDIYAGPDTFVTLGDSAVLHGIISGNDNIILVSDESEVTDDNRDTAHVRWELVSKPGWSSFSESQIDIDNIVTSFVPDEEGMYVFKLIATTYCDRDVDTATVIVQTTPIVCPTIPEFDAGLTALVEDGVPTYTNLHGRVWGQEPLDDITMEWTVADKPAASQISDDSIASRNGLEASAYVDVEGHYTFRLSLSNGCETRYFDVLRSVCGSPGCLHQEKDKCENHVQTPIVTTSEYQEGVVGSTMSFHAHAANPDFDDDDIHYHWYVYSKPTKSKLETSKLRNPSGEFVQVQADVKGFYRLKLEVVDGCGLKTHTFVDFGATCTSCPECEDCDTNKAPIASAGQSQTLRSMGRVELDASRSMDHDSEGLLYRWTFVDLPSSSKLNNHEIHGSYSRRPYFHPDAAGIYRVQLEVFDDCTKNVDEVEIDVCHTFKCSGGHTLEAHPIHDMQATEQRVVTPENAQPASMTGNVLDGIVFGVCVSAFVAVVVHFYRKSVGNNDSGVASNTQIAI